MQSNAGTVLVRTLSCLFILLAGCGIDVPAPQVSPAAVNSERLVAIESIVVGPQPISELVVATGTIAAKQTSNIGPLVEGVVEQIVVRVGDRVRTGDPLFRTRAVTYQRQAAEAESLVRVAEANSAQADRNFVRAVGLEQKRMVSRAERDDAETAVRVARAVLEQARARLATAKQDLADTVVTAPFDGAVTSRYVDEGVYMSNRFSGMGNSAVVQISELGIVGAIVRAPEAHIASLELGLPAKLFVAGFDQPFDSTILIYNDVVDPVTRTVELRLPILNPDYRVKPGQFVRAEIVPKPVAALVLPMGAVQGMGTSRHVFVVKDGRVSRRDVVAEDLDGERVRIKQGLEIGERVSASALGLSDGDRVTVEALHVAG